MSTKESKVMTWNDYIEKLPEEKRDIYFREEYVRLYKTKQDAAECFVFQEGPSIFLFPFLKRRISYLEGEYFDFETAYGYGGPVTTTNDPLFLKKALHQFHTLAKEQKIVAGFVRCHPFMANHEVLLDHCEVVSDRTTIAMDLTPSVEDILNKQIHQKHRNSIRKAQKLGLRYEVDHELKYINRFGKLYRATMHRREAEEFYYFNDRYFHNMRTLKDYVFLGTVWYGKKLIAAALFLTYGMYGHYHLAGSLNEFQEYCPNNFMIYETALYMKQQGIRRFHLGGGVTSDKTDSLYKFKRRFSNTEIPFYFGKMVLNQPIYQEICQLWEGQCPEKKEKYKHFVLKYRY